MDKIKRVLVPGIIFQSVIIGGGYASGREAMEYCAKYGMNGLFVIILCAALFSFLLFLSFLAAKKFQAYDYKSLSECLIKKYWILFELLFLFMAIIAISVVISTVATTASIHFNYNYILMTLLIILLLALLSFLGNKWIIRYKSVGSFLLYSIYIFFFVSIYFSKSEVKELNYEISLKPDWIISSITYVCYNLVAVPACFFTIKALKTKKEILWSSIIGGILAIIPMLLIFLILYDEVALQNEPLPLLNLIEAYLGKSVLLVYYFILIYTLSETGIGLIHAISDRIEVHLNYFKNIQFNKIYKVMIAIITSFFAFVLAQFGVINLVANWYGNAAWGFFLLFVIPLIILSPKLFLYYSKLNDEV